VPTVERWLCQAIRDAHDQDRRLFEERAHERSIVFHIARRLAAHVEAVAPEWVVDVDYDRWHADDITWLRKKLRLHAAADESDVYPDIIVHCRRGCSAEHNLLVVEVKKEEAEGHDRDIEKLQAFTRRPFLYRFAAFVELPKRWRTSSCRMDIRRATALNELFSCMTLSTCEGSRVPFRRNALAGRTRASSTAAIRSLLRHPVQLG
jgi:hypothetical protein